MSDLEDQQSPEEGDKTEFPSPDDGRDSYWVPVVYAIGLLMTAACMFFLAWGRGPTLATYLILAFVLLVIVSLARVTKRRHRAHPEIRSTRVLSRVLSCSLALIVVALFGTSLILEARRRDAKRQLAGRREAWRQEVEEQRNSVEIANKRASEALENYTEAFSSLGKKWEQVKTPDGETVSRPHRDAMKKLNHALDETRQAQDSRRLEVERLLQT
jgi:hypothetical protein